jgi:hypothetical protein
VQLGAAVTINRLGISLMLSTFWITLITGTPFLALLPTRIVQNVVMIPVQFLVLRLLKKPIGVYVKKQLA